MTAFHCTAKSGRQIIRQVVQVRIFNTRWGCPVPHPDGLEHLQGWGTQLWAAGSVQRTQHNIIRAQAQ